ncbi:MAG: LURP-one-related family protein [Clostridia bacterium]|nr:LURP-one-related family protein [Clostridia bacterium]
MKLYIKQQFFSWNDRFSVYDAYENELFTVEGELFSFGKQLAILDRNGNEVYRIEQELFRFRPRYHVVRNGEVQATVVKELSMFSPYYTVEGPGWEVQGDFFDHDYEITDGGRLVASVQKQWFTWGDTYEISVDDRLYDPEAVLAVVIIIDCVLDNQNN